MRASLLIFALLLPAPSFSQVARQYPWDNRPAMCMNAAEGSQRCAIPKVWQSISYNHHLLLSLLNSRDMELIGRAESELAYSQERLDDGEYRAALWQGALLQHFEHDANPEKLAGLWASELGPDGFACYAKAALAFGEASRARGTGWASTVMPEAMEIYETRLADANKFLDECPEKVKQTLPWHSMKVSIAYMLPSLHDQRESQLKKAIAAWPDAKQIYLPAMNYSQPVWGGSFAELERLARMAVDASQETKRTALYAELYGAILAMSATDSISDSDADWEAMKRSFRDVEALGAYPSYEPGHFALLACAKRDRAEAKRLMEWAEQTARKEYGPNYGRRDMTDPCVKFAFSTESE